MSKGPNEGVSGVEPVVEFERFGPDGERFVPYPYVVDGLFRMGDPAHKNTKHHANNQISVSVSEIGAYLLRGFHLRMRGEVGGQVNMINPSEIRKI